MIRVNLREINYDFPHCANVTAHWTERNFYNKDTHSFTKSQSIEVIVEDSNDEQSIDQLYKDDGSAFPKDQPPDFNFQDDIALLPYSSGTFKKSRQLWFQVLF